MSKVVTFIAFLINYRPWGSFMKLSVGNVKMTMGSSVTENKLNDQKDVKKRDTALNRAFYLSKWPFFRPFEEIYAVKTVNLKKILKETKSRAQTPQVF